MKTVKIFLAIILLVFSYQTANARIIHVPTDSSTIQKGINGAVDGDTVLVDRGTYLETIDFLQKDILVASNFIFDSLEATVDSTIIDGGGILITSVVTMRYVNGANSGITGFTLTNGYAQNGGGINCEYSSATISHNLITENTAEVSGGGIRCKNEPGPTISNNRIIGNSSLSKGGGIFLDDCWPRIVNNLIESNEASYGGGIYVGGYSSSPEIKGNQILGNRAEHVGGGIRVIEADVPTIDSNTINYNFAEEGGGIAFYNNPSGIITNNEIRGDTAYCYGGGIYVRHCSLTIDANQILNNLASVGGGVMYSDSSFGEIYGNIMRKNRAWSDNGGGNGGGLHISGGSYPNIHNNIIDSNTVRYYGGGISCTGGSSPNITDNDIVANDGPAGGGGISCGSSSPMIERNTIRENEGDCGGGILVRSSHATIRFNLIVRNESPSYAGGVEFFEDTSSFVNNTIDSNSASGYNAGGGLYCTQYSAPEIRNNIITNSLDGCGITCSPTSHPHISYNDVWRNHDGDFCGCDSAVGDTSWGECCYYDTPCDSFHNIIADPLFDPDSTNYFLLCNSPCIDAGDPSDPVPPDGGCFIDMGAVEYPYLLGDANGDGVHDIGDIVFKINYLFLGTAPPCPLSAADDNCDHVVNVGDIISEINRLFGEGSPQVCGGEEPSGANPLSKLRPTSSFAEISLSKPKFTKDGVAEIIVTGKFDVELAAVQLEVNYDPEQIRVIEPALTPRCEGLQVYFGSADGQLKIGILDINGAHRIPAGEGPILTLKAKAKDLGSLKISKAILVDQNANTFLANVVEKLETATSLPDQYSLHQNCPNPFNPETQISYDLSNDSWVKLSIYNIRGQKVKELVDGFEAAGHKTVMWNGKNQDGEQIASGVYFYRLEAGEFIATKKMVMIR